ncbi:hypothetical protein Marpi_2033 [Marinitoga piezophila KA3]|uniref:Uncharacterized protein n=1 Tax=Marinitoga piezophila (strain DSM 14283 / JCM 11233 / KA3) TaxID=443254 RepID=H2J739_MARPK|nr:MULTISPECIES: hypothetical protein [Marinitoga]AEX86409.1 hypothetical protein Marpi_2033 [Marinitoga piezophila KA3]APT76799.1 hypothetical protein LN42_10745 [Marinitoga sp. 1137]
MKKSIVTIILLTLLSLTLFGFSGDLNYIYGYNFSNNASTTFSGLKTNITLENELDNLYYRFSIDLFKLDGFDLNVNSDIDTTQYAALMPSSVYLISPSLPWALYVLNEAFADIYLDEATLRVGRFIPDSGSSTFYSPSVTIPAHDGINPFEPLKTLPVDGIYLNGYIADYTYELTFTPKTYDDIPSFILYPKTINETIISENAATLTYAFTTKKEEVEKATEELVALLLSKGLTEAQVKYYLSNPASLTDLGFTQEQIGEIYAGQTLMTLPDTYEVKNTYTETKDIDELLPVNSDYSAKVSMDISNYNIKLGYTHDHYHFTVPETIEINYSKDGTGTSKTTLYRPYRNVVTLDFQGVSYFFDSIGYHGEAALIMPEKTYVKVDTTYYVPNPENPTTTVQTKDSTEVDIFEKYYVKAVGGIEYTHGEDFTLGIEGFNGLPTEELKGHLSFGSDMYIKAKINNVSFEGLGLAAFSKINDKYEPGYMGTLKIAYNGIDNFEPSIQLKYAYAESDQHSLKSMEDLNSISLNIKIYF